MRGVSINKNQEFKNNLDLILPDELNLNYNVHCIFRKSNNEKNHKFRIKNIKANF